MLNLVKLNKEADIPSGATSFADLVLNTENEKAMAAHERALEEFEHLSENIAESSMTVEEKYSMWETLATGFVERIKLIASSIDLELEMMLEEATKRITGNTVDNAMITESVVTNTGEKIIQTIHYATQELSNGLSLDEYDQYYSQKQFQKSSFGFTAGDIVRWNLPGNFGIGIIKSFAGDMAKPVAKIQLLQERPDGTFALLDETTEQPFEILKLREDSVIKDVEGAFTLTKSKENGKLFWYGTFTNKYKDRHGEIISQQAHKEYAQNINSGLIPKPPLVFWHIPKALGSTDFVEFLDEGFVAVGGFIYPEYEELILNISKSAAERGEQLGMSHHSKGLINNEKVISFYYSDEITFLPLDEAANSLTAMTVV